MVSVCIFEVLLYRHFGSNPLFMGVETDEIAENLLGRVEGERNGEVRDSTPRPPGF